MTAILKHINLAYPEAVPILIGAPEALVTMKETCGKYTTKRAEGNRVNRHIKVFSTYFLLKALTTAPLIQQWRQQRSHLLAWLQMSERTLDNRLKQMEHLKLIAIKNGNIELASYRDAADIMGIYYAGTVSIPYNPIQNAGNQIFQYYLRAEECRDAQAKQLNALWYYLHKNENIPLLSQLLSYLDQMPRVDRKRLRDDPGYFQEKLLQLQLSSFKESSEILDVVFKRRADINRSVLRIKRDHCFKSTGSVWYMKKRMERLKLITIEKKTVNSLGRSRIYYQEGDQRRDGYVYNTHTGWTALILADQINFSYERIPKKTGESSASKAAA